MRPASEALPPKLLDILSKRKRGERGIQKEPKKILITIRYSQEVINYFETKGKGWQTEMNNVLKQYVKKHPKNDSLNLKHSKNRKNTRKSA